MYNIRIHIHVSYPNMLVSLGHSQTTIFGIYEYIVHFMVNIVCFFNCIYMQLSLFVIASIHQMDHLNTLNYVLLIFMVRDCGYD